MTYNWLTFGDAKTQLSERLDDLAQQKWPNEEVGLWIIEALRMYNCLTETWKAEFVFNPTDNWNQLWMTAGSPRLRTVTDTQVYVLMEYALTEPPTGATWTGTDQFTIEDLAGALQRRRDEILQVANCNQAVIILPSILGGRRVILPQTVLEPQRVRFVGGETTYGPALEQDQFNRTDPITSSFSGVAAVSNTSMWGASLPGDVFDSFGVTQPDSKLFLTFLNSSRGIIQTIDLSTVGSSVTAPSGTTSFMVSANGATSGQTYSLDFHVNGNDYSYTVVPNSGNFETDFSSDQNDSVVSCVPFGPAVAGTRFNFTASSSPQFFSLIFYDSSRGVLQANVVSNSLFTAPTGTAFWSVTYNPNTDPDQSSSATYTISIPISEETTPPRTLMRSSQIASEFFIPDFPNEAANLPSEWMVSSEPPLALDVDKAPSVAGQYELVVLQSGTPFDPPTPVLLGIPDDFAWVARLGALADLLGRESDATDIPRAEWCQKRYEDGLKLISAAPWVYLASINGQPVDVSSMTKEDSWSPEWDSDPNFISTAVIAGMDLIWLPTTGSAGLTLIGNAPIPSGDDDFVQVSHSAWDAILSYAQFLASFVMGGAEFLSASGLEKIFITACAQENARLKKLGTFTDILDTRSMSQVDQTERW